ncbi:MAG: insulinase family protein [Pseudomonadota bacterium]
MNFHRTHLLAASFALALPYPVIAQPAPARESSAGAGVTPPPVWAFEESDIEVDQGYVFGRLDNGMRYILRENATPEGTALVRMRIDSGSLDESEEERGLSHYLEHMAFNGSTGIPEGEMIKLLEREGLAFGADTNAGTGLEAITYMLNLPRNDEALLDTALMLMRETASELTISEGAVDRERGVILAERRDRRNFAQRAQEDSFDFLAPGARFAQRWPIGVLEVLEIADAATIRKLYERTYVPENTVLVIVGDYPIEVLEAKVRAQFSDWSGGPAPEDPKTGPIDVSRKGMTDIYLDPSLSESVSVSQFGTWIDQPDTLANRKASILRSIGYDILNRRLTRLAREADAPFQSAGFGVGDFFEDARSAGLTINTVDGEWRKGLLAAVREYNQAVTFGFTQAEIEEQLARRRTALQNTVEAKDTRSNSVFASAALSLVGNDRVPTDPDYRLALFEEIAPEITPESVFAAMTSHLVAFDDPLIRFQGRAAPEGGEDALRAAYLEGLSLAIAAPEEAAQAAFAYTDFGEPGEIVSDTVESQLGVREIVFENGVKLNLKRTDVREDRIAVRVAIDGGNLMATQEDPLAVYLAGSLGLGGLGKHSEDELTTILAGRSVRFGMRSGTDSFTMTSTTTPRDLELQLQVMAALITDPGYRAEGVERFRRGIDNFFETLTATPGRALGAAYGREISDGDPRFSLQPIEAFKALDYDQLQAIIADRLAKGAIEVAVVGDVDEDAAIAQVAATLGALDPREAEFRLREAARVRTFTQDRSARLLEHDGEADQALVRLVWPARDDSDYEETVQLQMLGRIMRLELTDRIREQLGQAYSPSASVRLSRFYDGYGTISINVSVDESQVEATREAIGQMVKDLMADGVTEDLMNRARKPLLERHENALKGLGGYTSLAARAQTDPERIERYFAYPETLSGVTIADVQSMARRYLKPEDSVSLIVTPSADAKAKAASETDLAAS